MLVTEFLSRFDKVKKSADQWLVLCPAHADKNPSLAVKEGSDGAILLKCHAGCSTDAILSALQLDPADLFPTKDTAPKKTVVAEYLYQDEQGTVLHKKLRYTPKGFAQCRPDGSGGWVFNLHGVRKVVYRLPELLGQRAILVVEGEKDVDAAWAIGVPATCNPDGAGKWLPEYGRMLVTQGVQRAAVIPDHDQPGAAHSAVVAASLQHVGIDVRIVPLPDVPEHGDLSDYLAAGHGKAHLLALIKTAWTLPLVEVVPPEPIPPKRFQELGEQRYTLTLQPEGIIFEANRLRRSSQELHGELLVRVNGYFPNARTFGDGILQVGDMNFSSTTTRSSRAKLLAERAGDKAFDWYGTLEEFITEVIAAERRGKPAEVLSQADDEDDESSEAWVIDGFPLLRQLPEIVFGDAACVAGDTRLEGPYGSRTIQDLASSGERHVVWAMSPNGPQPVLSEVPFLKGFAHLYRFTMQSGRTVTVTRDHRFLTSHGWQRAGDLVVGDVLAGFSPYGPQISEREGGADQQPTNSGHIPLASLQGGFHSDQTIEDSSDRYSTHRHRDGGQLLPLSERAQECAPSRADVAARNHRQWPSDGPSVTRGHSPVYQQRFLRPNSGSSRLGMNSVACVESRIVSSHATPRSLNSRVDRPSPLTKDRSSRALESSQWGEEEAGDLFSASELLRGGVYNDAIVSVSYIGWRPFFDVTIPKFANYCANGFWHHNSGKSYFAMWIAGKLAADGVNVLYADWEFSKSEHKKRLTRLFQPMPNNLLYIRCDHPLKQEVDHLIDVIQKHQIQYIVCDSIGFAVDGPAESQEGAAGYFRYLRQLKVGSLNIAHIPKQFDDNREATVFGSVFFKAGARSIWFIDRAKENPTGEIRFGLYHRKNNVGALLQPKGFKLTFRGETTTVDAINLKDVEELAAGYPLLDRMRELLVSGPMTVKAIAEELSSTVTNVRAVLSRHRSQFIKTGSKIGVSSGRPDDNAEGVTEF